MRGEIVDPRYQLLSENPKSQLLTLLQRSLVTVMAVAAQAAVYDFIPPMNMTQWVETCSVVLNEYERASKAGASELQTRAMRFAAFATASVDKA